MIVETALALLATPPLLAAAYLFLLAALSRRARPGPYPPRRLRFEVIVPAHDEERGIERTVGSLLALDWPRDRLRVTVVADNCSDRTAQRAAEAGAEVLVRDDPARRGKGHALQHAFSRVLERGAADAVVVVDADAEVSPNLLSAFARRLEAGARAVQASSGVLNPDDSWRTRLMAIALTLVGDVRSLGRERLGLSCGLRGIGMCLSVEALRAVPFEAFSIVEDAEYSVALARAGIRVRFAGDARVASEMATGAAAARTQRLRWEGGRRALRRAEGFSLLGEGLARRDPVRLDLALDLVIPPLARLSAVTAAGLLAAIALVAAGLSHAVAALPWAVTCLLLGLYVARGVQLSGLGLRGAAALAWAPVFMGWKALLLRERGGEPDWVRTARNVDARPDDAVAPAPEPAPRRSALP